LPITWTTIASGTRIAVLPLCALLTKHLVEKSGGRSFADPSNAEKAMVRMEFPIVEYRKKN
jgi:hypothetical protein